MDVPELLEAASLLVPEETATENDITVRDIWDYLVHDEWEIALDLLEESGTPARFLWPSGNSSPKPLSSFGWSGARGGAIGDAPNSATVRSGRI
ncbi:hypothetical protein SHIRM173S_00634 [Streptomyces hirsutus]